MESKQSKGKSDQNWTVAEENGIAVGGGFTFSLDLQQLFRATKYYLTSPCRMHFVAKIQFVKITFLLFVLNLQLLPCLLWNFKPGCYNIL